MEQEYFPLIGIVLEWIPYYHIIPYFAVLFLSQWRGKVLSSVSVILIEKGGSICGTFLAVCLKFLPYLDVLGS